MRCFTVHCAKGAAAAACTPAQGLPATARRWMRSRVGVSTKELLRAAELDEPATASARPPPSGMDLSYITDKRPDLVAAHQTEPDVWAAGTFRAAWCALHKAYAAALVTDAARADELRARDWLGLALCNAYAETLHLLSLLPPTLRAAVTAHPVFDPAGVEELFVHVGQEVEVRGSGGWVIQLPPPSAAELQHMMKQIGRFGSDGRACVANTAHRASVWRGRHGEPLGVTLRVGRYVPGAARALLPLAQRGSLLILSKAGMGKTTLLRDLAAALAQGPDMPRVTVVDTSNEIGGDGPIPLPYLGRCRRIQVASREAQSQVMTEVLQNHTPDYVIVDEIATVAEAEAAWSISQRGVHLIGTCHGEHLEGLLQNRALNMLVGGTAQAFLSNEERRLRNKTRKSVLERPFSSPFPFVVELHERNRGHLYVDVNKAVDLILDEQSAHGSASVGAPVHLTAALPRRVEALLRAQEAVRRRQRSVQQTVGEECDEESEDAQADLTGAATGPGLSGVDEDGYTAMRGPAGDATAPTAPSLGSRSRPWQRAGKRQRPRKSDEELYEDLRGFF